MIPRNTLSNELRIYFNSLESDFIEKAGSLHIIWVETFNEKENKIFDFLTFYIELFRSYKNRYGDKIKELEELDWNPEKFKTYSTEIDKAKTPEEFSKRIITWANEVIEHPENKNLEYPLESLKHDEFWKLLSFIDKKFEEWLRVNPSWSYDFSPITQEKV
jgi:hypothetical protein